VSAVVIVTAILAPVIPPPSASMRGQRSSPAKPRRPIPLASLAPHPDTTAVYGLAAVDSTGRVVDRAITQALGWTPGIRLHIRINGGLIVVESDVHGVFAISGQGHVRLPARVRHWCRLATGDRVLLVADPAIQRLVVHPPAALTAMVAVAHSEALARGVQ
jgi:hypothetical protein